MRASKVSMDPLFPGESSPQNAQDSTPPAEGASGAPPTDGTPFAVIEGGGSTSASARRRQRFVQTIGDCELPYGYEAWDEGLFMTVAQTEGAGEDGASGGYEPSIERTMPTMRRMQVKQIAAKPLWISRFGRDMVSDTELVELATKDLRDNRVTAEWVQRIDLADKRRIVELAARGFMITTGNAAAVVDYLERLMKLNSQRLPWVDVAKRAGAVQVGSSWGWLLGETWIGPPDTAVVPDPISGGETRKLGVRGDEDTWFSKFEEICEASAVARWLTYSSFAAPLLRFIRRRTFIIHHWGLSGTGKTSLAKFAMSVWGEPHALTETFNRTEKSFTELFEYLSDLPLCFDELQASTNEDHANVIYALCLEKGRGRARKTGGLEKTVANWRSVVRMTGEEPIIGKGKLNLGGQSNRVLELNAPGVDKTKAGAIHRWLEQGHYGWGGVRFLENLSAFLQKNPEDGERQLLQLYVDLRLQLEQDARWAPLGDRTGHLAVVALAQYLASRWLFRAPPEAARAQALADAATIAALLVEDDAQTPSMTEQALQFLRDHRSSQAALWFSSAKQADLDAINNGTYGRLFAVQRPPAGEVWLVQGEANALLKRAGLPPRAVWNDLRTKGVLRADKDGPNLAVVRKLGTFRNRVYVIDLAALDGPDADQ